MYLTKEQIALCVQAILKQGLKESLESNREKARAVLDAIGEHTFSYSHFSADNFLYNANMGDDFGTENFPYCYRSPFEIISSNPQSFTSKHNDIIMVWAGAFGLVEYDSQLQFAPSSKPGWVKVLN